jgi:adenosylmethionine---8-amino-7-oxononanoate aminotransferase
MHPNVWHPFTILKDSLQPLKVVSGKGIWLELEDGQRVVDCISSWWVNLHGHSHPVIVEAIKKQAETLEHVIFANFTHEPAEQLAEKLTQKLPGALNKVFYSDNGSTAVEVALKIAWQYWENRGQKRKKFIAFEGSYHGDTFGAMSVGSRSVFSHVFSNLLFDVEYVPYPENWMGSKTANERENYVIELLETKMLRNPEDYAGIIIEPLVQGAGGMRMCRPEFLQKLKKVSRKFPALLIYDEVMTGFGRTGDLFASTKSGTEPDIICLSKGITGGFLPFAATVCSDRVYETFYSEDPLKTFWHGHSYTANPIGCAAALASLELLIYNREKFETMQQKHESLMLSLATMDRIDKIRVTGTIAAFTVKNNSESGYFNKIGNAVKKECIKYGILIRPLGDVIYLMPPYCITDEELKMVYEKLGKLLESQFKEFA